jgi:AcrR family transcriptional regulator
MAIPTPAGQSGVSSELIWSQLDAEQKRERLLAAAGEVFAREGIEAPMPAVAAAAGAGVGSVYRQFPSKEDLLAALAIRRLDTVALDIEAAAARGGEAWPALVELLWELADRGASDDVVAEAIATVSEHPAVAARHQLCEAELERIMSAARAQGTLRADARPSDVRLLLAAVRAARRQDASGWRRMLELGLDGLAAERLRGRLPDGPPGELSPRAG